MSVIEKITAMDARMCSLEFLMLEIHQALCGKRSPTPPPADKKRSRSKSRSRSPRPQRQRITRDNEYRFSVMTTVPNKDIARSALEGAFKHYGEVLRIFGPWHSKTRDSYLCRVLYEDTNSVGVCLADKEHLEGLGFGVFYQDKK